MFNKIMKAKNCKFQYCVRVNFCNFHTGQVKQLVQVPKSCIFYMKSLFAYEETKIYSHNLKAKILWNPLFYNFVAVIFCKFCKTTKFW